MKLALRVMAVAIAVAAGSASAQDPAPARLIRQCKVLYDAYRDVSSTLGSLPLGTESQIAFTIAQKALMSSNTCDAVTDLLAVLASIPVEARGPATAFIRRRMSDYASRLEPDISYLNQMAVITRIPGVGRSAESVRDKMRAFGDLLTELAP